MSLELIKAKTSRWNLTGCAMLLAGLLPLLCAHAETTAAYSDDTGASDQRLNWMAVFPDSTKINSLSIPATHESMALYGGSVGYVAICQVKSLNDQLTMGIRALDIRCRHINNTFAIHHGQIYENATFGNDVLAVCRSFLLSHPSETILMRVKEEYDASGDTREFYQTFD
jgi:1-phosphatidylinositol phosphodiesterase